MLYQGKLNIRICRDVTGPHSPSILLSQRAATVQESAGARNGGKRDVVWGGVDMKGDDDL